MTEGKKNINRRFAVLARRGKNHLLLWLLVTQYLMLQTFHESRERKKDFASSGNRTRAARVAGEHSTTEPTMLSCQNDKIVES